MYLYYHWNPVFYGLLITAIVVTIPLILSWLALTVVAISDNDWDEYWGCMGTVTFLLGIFPALFWGIWSFSTYAPINPVFDLHIKNETLDITYKNVTDCGEKYPDLYINYSTHEYFNIKVLVTDTTVITQLNLKYLSNNEIYHYYWLKG